MYYLGKGVTQDYAQALQWYRKAAEQGLASAQYMLGLMYDEGKGVQRNYVQAYRWFSAAAAQGYSNASEALDRLEEKMTPEQIARAQKFN